MRLGARHRLVLAAGIVAVALRVAAPGPPERNAGAVAAMLGAQAGAVVGPDDFVWEERGGFLGDAFFGRRVLFLAAPRGEPGFPRDLYRARVTLTRTGLPIAVHGIANLTSTPLGDDGSLEARGRRVAFATTAYGAVQGVTLLDLGGEGPARDARPWSARIASAISSWLATGSGRGIGRTEITFSDPPAEAKLELTDDALVLALGPEGLPAALDLRDGSLNPGPKNRYGARVQVVSGRSRAAADVLADACGAIVGEKGEKAAAFALASARRVRRAASRIRAEATPSPPAVAAPAGPSGLAPESAPSDGWPPPPLVPVVEPPVPGEGSWTPATSPILPPRIGAVTSPGAGDPPPYFFATSVRPDPSLPRAVVRMVAIDARQLSIRYQAGTDRPRPLTGPRGWGRLPPSLGRPSPRAESPARPSSSVGSARSEDRVVAAFNGGWTRRVGEMGAAADRRILVPPTRGAPVLAVEADGALGVGLFAAGHSDGGPGAAPLPLRQAPNALLDRGAVLPGGPIPIDGASEIAVRSALCVTSGGHSIYAWGIDVTAAALARALALASCEYAVHLAEGPEAAGFAYLARAEAADPAGFELLDPRMSFAPGRLHEGSPDDFFYVVMEDPRPRGPGVDDMDWQPEGGAQPAPAWLPAVHEASGAYLGAQVRLTLFAPRRFAWHVRAGTRELRHASGAFPTALADADAARALAAIGLGAAKRRAARGLAIDGSTGLAFRADAGALVIDPRTGAVAVSRTSDLAGPIAGDAVELPLTADEGKLRDEAREVGAMRARAAACSLEDGTLAIATTTFDSDEATTTALLALGCERIAALDRGSHHAAFVHRAGTETPPLAHYEATVLYAVEAPMRGRGHRIGE